MEAQVNLIDQETTAKKHSINVDEPEPAPSEQPSYRFEIKKNFVQLLCKFNFAVVSTKNNCKIK